jgi:uncharacterized hydrophobic protein (TIGR00271 family)
MNSADLIKNYLKKIFHLQDTTDQEGTVNNINENIDLKGYNIWILICSAVLASIGLDVNSAAVIIGAMLISPLMSPILGVGLSFGINDKEMLTRSLRNLGMATFISLTTAYIYFTITPLGDATAEILARTQPTLLDVMVAFFGGIAGIVSGSRKEKTNAIPGVAIATALMPPLCSAGFGLATGQLMIFAGAFYLFIINAIFISLSTYLVIKFLQFPLRQYMDVKTRKRVSRIMSFALLFVVIPSGYFLWEVYLKNKMNRQVQNIIINKISNDETEVLKWNIENRDSLKYVQVVIAGKPVSEKEIASYDSLLKASGFDDLRIKLSRVNVSKEEIADMSREVAASMLNAINLKAATPINNKDNVYATSDISKELAVLYPEASQISIGEMVNLKQSGNSNDTLTHVIINWKKKTSLSNQEAKKLYAFLKLRLGKDTLIILNK